MNGETITVGRFIFSRTLRVLVRFFRFRIKFSLIPALKHAVNRHFWHRCRSVPDVKSHEFCPKRQMYSTLFKTDLRKKPSILFHKDSLRDSKLSQFLWKITNKNLYIPHKIERNNESHLTDANKLHRLHFLFLLSKVCRVIFERYFSSKFPCWVILYDIIYMI